MNNEINHRGIIERIEGSVIYVRIMQESACSGCHAQHLCSASEQKEKVIEVTDNSNTYKLNEYVTIIGKTSMGLQAVFLAFVVPIILMLLVLILGNILSWNEAFSALFGLMLLIPWYGLLYLLRNQLKKKFIFTLKKT